MAKFIITRGTRNSGKTMVTGLIYQKLLILKEKTEGNKTHEFNKQKVETHSLIITNDESGNKKTQDFIAILELQNKKIGLISAGDIANDLKNDIEYLINKGVSIIICCTRSINKEGSSYKMLNDNYLHKGEHYLIKDFWTSNFQNKEDLANEVINKIKEDKN